MIGFVPETALDHHEIFRRGGRNLGDEDFALFKCPLCGHVYLIDYEAETVYLDANDLSRRVVAFEKSFTCVQCNQLVPDDEPWVGKMASPRFLVTWDELRLSAWAWAVGEAVATPTS